MKQAIVDIVLERANNHCEMCGSGGDNFALHHRKLKSQGGKDEPCNLIAVHHKCHNLGTNSIHLNPKRSIENGWIVPSWAEPSGFPLRMADGSKVLLDNEGSYTTMKEGSDGTDRSYW
jgi:hypothetical protein